MVDVGHRIDQVVRSTAHTDLENQLWQRDSDAKYKLTLLEHQQKLQKTYASCLADGWTKDEMRSEQSMDWLVSNVAWRIEQTGKAEYDYEYMCLAYDAIIY